MSQKFISTWNLEAKIQIPENLNLCRIGLHNTVQQPESQNFLDPGLRKPYSQLKIVLKIQTQVKYDRTAITQTPGLNVS